ncbi:penicillin-binding protein [Kineosporia rhizophila]|uniref:transglycosylase domain-containing protein n=2 Tax=Kineosporia TaxID=49184 RepID=UPI001E528936|nr:penicillin-binding protein [Kineosporia rhizophila]
MERPSGPSRGRSGSPEGEPNGLGGRRLGNTPGGQRANNQPGLGGRRLGAQGQQARQGLGGNRNNGQNGQGQGLGGRSASQSRRPEQPDARYSQPPEDSRRRSSGPVSEHRSAPVAPPSPSRPSSSRPDSSSSRPDSRPPAAPSRPAASSRSAAASRPVEAPSPYDRDPYQRDEPMRPAGGPHTPRPSSRTADPYSSSSAADHSDAHTVAYGASPYDEMGGPAQSPDGMPSARRPQNRLRDSRAGRLLADTGALSLFGRQEDEQLDSTTAPPRRNPRPRGPGGGGNLPPQGYHRFINYPRWGKRGVKRWLPSWKLISGMFTLGLLMVAGAVFWFWNSVSLPTSQDELVNAQTTTVFFANGKAELGELKVQDREKVDLANVPEHVQQAVIAAEDNTFYTNSGVQWTSIARAALSTVTGGDTGGGSTITQQYVKNIYDQKELTYQRKMREAVMAMKVSQQKSKPEILESYLNTIYWGRDTWGIQAASKAYFDKESRDLTISEGAYLAGIVNSPNNADPRADEAGRKRAEFRWNVVLDAMVKEGWLAADKRAEMKFPKVIKEKQDTSITGQNAYLMEMVKEEAAEVVGIPEEELTTGGYEVTTTFNKGLVKAAEKAVKEQTPDFAPKGLRVGMATIDPRDGSVLSIYGGKNITKEMNQATKDGAQAASTFKAFGLLAALKDGVSLDSYYDGNDGRVIRGAGDSRKISNFGNTDYGWINLVKATANSVNTVYVDMNNQVGPEKMRQAAIDAGIPESDDLQKNLVNVLGSTSVHPIDLASAYGTLAAQGIHRDWHVIKSVKKVETGEVMFKADKDATKGERVFDEGVVADATYALEHVVTEGSGEKAQALNRPVAGKTGSSTDNLSAWFVGYTPQMVTAVGLHQVKKDGQSLAQMKGWDSSLPQVTGGSVPTDIWTAFMLDALEGKEVIEFPDPVNGGEVVSASPTPEVTVEPTPTETPSAQPTQTMEPTEQPSQPVQPTETGTPSVEPTETVGDGEGEVDPTEDPNNGGIFPTEDSDDEGNDGFG